MFTVTQNRFAFKPHKDRGRKIYSLYKEGKTFADIARDSEVVDMSGGFVLTRERVRKIVRKLEQKSTD